MNSAPNNATSIHFRSKLCVVLLQQGPPNEAPPPLYGAPPHHGLWPAQLHGGSCRWGWALTALPRYRSGKKMSDLVSRFTLRGVLVYTSSFVGYCLARAALLLPLHFSFHVLCHLLICCTIRLYDCAFVDVLLFSEPHKQFCQPWMFVCTPKLVDCVVLCTTATNIVSCTPLLGRCVP